MRRTLRIVFWTYLVLLHAAIVYAVVKVSTASPSGSGFSTRIERAHFGAGMQTLLGPGSSSPTEVTRVYTPETMYVAWIGERDGEVTEILIQPPGHVFEWCFRRDSANTPWSLSVSERSVPNKGSTSLGDVALLLDQNADGVPERRIELLGLRAKFNAADPFWIPIEPTP